MVEPTPLRTATSSHIDLYVADLIADAPDPQPEQMANLSALLGPLLSKTAKPSTRRQHTRRAA
jgi:hypothetical protein